VRLAERRQGIAELYERLVGLIEKLD